MHILNTEFASRICLHFSEPLLDARVNDKTKGSSSTGSDEIALNLDGDDDDDEGLMEVDLGDAENQCQESKPRGKHSRIFSYTPIHSKTYIFS